MSQLMLESKVSDGYKSKYRNSGLLHIRNLYLVSTSGYHHQHHRPYHLDTSLHALENTVETIFDNGLNSGYQVTPSMVSHSNSRIFNINPIAGDVISIVNGWSEERFRFMLVVDWYDRDYTDRLLATEFITGFTDYKGLSTSALDPYMEFHVTGVNNYRVREIYSNGNSHRRLYKDNSSNVISGAHLDDDSDQKQYLITPYAVSNHVVSTDYINDDAVMEIFGSNCSLTTDSNVISSQYGKLSNINNNNPVRATATLLTSMITSSIKDNIIDERFIRTEHGLSSSIRDNLRLAERSYTSDNFLNTISNRTGVRSGVFLYQDLTDIDADLDARDDTRVHIIDNRMSRTFHVDSHHLSGSDLTTIHAVSLSHILPSIMTERGVLSYSFVATNMNAGTGGFNINGINDHVLTTGMNTVFGEFVDESAIVNSMEFSVIEEIVPMLKEANDSYYVKVDCDLSGDCIIEIMDDDGIMVPYVLPLFAVALYAPVVTGDMNDISRLAKHFKNLSSAIHERCSRRTLKYPTRETFVRDTYSAHDSIVTDMRSSAGLFGGYAAE